MLTLLPLVAALMGGCYKNTIETGARAGESHTETVAFLLWGLVGDASFDVDKICPQGVARIEEEMGPVDAVLNCVTCSIYSPRTITITCADGRAYNLQENAETGMSTVVAMEVE
ncbi:MAG: hypothetical protein VX899_19100 [Myxococcota bacterium]|nr:hypothetical protein [Myxococcota bacterium]